MHKNNRCPKILRLINNDCGKYLGVNHLAINALPGYYISQIDYWHIHFILHIHRIDIVFLNQNYKIIQLIKQDGRRFEGKWTTWFLASQQTWELCQTGSSTTQAHMVLWKVLWSYPVCIFWSVFSKEKFLTQHYIGVIFLFFRIF